MSIELDLTDTIIAWCTKHNIKCTFSQDGEDIVAQPEIKDTDVLNKFMKEVLEINRENGDNNEN